MQQRVHPEGPELQRPKSQVEWKSTSDAVLSPQPVKARNIFAAKDQGPTAGALVAPLHGSSPELANRGSDAAPSPGADHGCPPGAHAAPGQRLSDTLGSLRQWWKPISLDNPWYEKWTWVCTFAALLTGWVAPFLMAWEGTPGLDQLTWTVLQWVLVAIFTCDALSKFVLEYEDPVTGQRVADFKKIAVNYTRTMLIPDILYVVPWSQVILAALHLQDSENDTALLIGLLRLLQLGRMYRFSAFVAMLEYRMVLPQTALVIWRNNLYVLGSSHIAGCLFFLIARLEHFGPDSWVGRHYDRFDGLNVFGQYVYSLYFALAAFTGLGDNDFYMASVAEACVMGLFLLFNMLLGAYILGTVTMLMVKGDKRMKQHRDRITNLRAYSQLNSLPARLQTAMERHNELHFHNDQASDEQVLSIYPQTIRRRVLRFLYQDALQSCYLFHGCNTQFLEMVLTSSRLEQFMPQEQVMAEGDHIDDIYIMLEGQAEVTVGGRLPPHLRELMDKGPARAQTAGRALSTAALKRAKSAAVNLPRSSGTQVTLDAAEAAPGRMGSSPGIGAAWSTAGAKPPCEASTTSAYSRQGLPSHCLSPFAGAHRPASQLSRFGATKGPLATLQRSQSCDSLALTDINISGRLSRVSFGSSAAGDRSGHGPHLGAQPPAPHTGSELIAGSCFGQTSFFAELPSHCSVWSSTVIKVLVVSRRAYEELLTTYPHQTRKLLENMERHAEEEVRHEILSSLLGVRHISPELSTALREIAQRDKRPSELTAAAMMEIRELLDKSRRALLDNLAKVKEALARYVRKVDQDLVYAFLNSCADGDVARTRTMLAAGMSPNVVDYNRRTGLMLACNKGHEQVARLLLEAGADTQLRDAFGNTAMYECVKLGSDELVELLLEFGGSLGMDTVAIGSQLCDLVKQGNLPQLARFIHAGAPVNVVDYNGMSPLHVAALCSNLAAVQVLVSEGGALLTARNVWGRTPLEEAEQLGDQSIIRFLSSLTANAQTAAQQLQRDIKFLDACSKGQLSEVQDALKHGQSPDTHDYDHRTGLMLACHARHMDVVKALLQAGADPAFEDNFGHTAMWEAAQAHSGDLVEVLLQYGGSLAHHPSTALASQLSQRVAEEDLAQLLLLVRAGADPDSTDYVGQTPLHVAATLGHLATVRLLVEEANATVNAEDVFGRTPLESATAARIAADEPDLFDDVIAYLDPLTAAAEQGVIKNRLNPHALPAMLLLHDTDLPRIRPLAAVPVGKFEAPSADSAAHMHEQHQRQLRQPQPGAAEGSGKLAGQLLPERASGDLVLKLPTPLIGRRQANTSADSTAGGVAHGLVGLGGRDGQGSMQATLARYTSHKERHHSSHVGKQESTLSRRQSLVPTLSHTTSVARSRRGSAQHAIQDVIRHVEGVVSGRTALVSASGTTNADTPGSPGAIAFASNNNNTIFKDMSGVSSQVSGPATQHAVQQLLGQLESELGLGGSVAGLDEIVSEYQPVRKSTVAARTTRALTAGPGGAMKHPDVSGEAPAVNTAMLKRARRASQQIELAALQAGWPGLDPGLYTELSVGRGADQRSPSATTSAVSPGTSAVHDTVGPQDRAAAIKGAVGDAPVLPGKLDLRSLAVSGQQEVADQGVITARDIEADLAELGMDDIAASEREGRPGSDVGQTGPQASSKAALSALATSGPGHLPAVSEGSEAGVAEAPASPLPPAAGREL